jgi:hypothetical protein
MKHLTLLPLLIVIVTVKAVLCSSRHHGIEASKALAGYYMWAWVT